MKAPALAGDGAALELGIGTGRVALPLSARGVPVQGIDLSPDMVAQLQAKPGAADIGVTVGDFATTTVPGSFRLAYLVYNTIENLTSQDDQVACFVNAGRHLSPGGCFVVEVEVPQLRRLPPGETALAFNVTPDRVGFDTIDVAQQRGVSHHYWVGAGRAEPGSVHDRAGVGILGLGLIRRQQAGQVVAEPFRIEARRRDHQQRGVLAEGGQRGRHHRLRRLGYGDGGVGGAQERRQHGVAAQLPWQRRQAPGGQGGQR